MGPTIGPTSGSGAAVNKPPQLMTSEELSLKLAALMSGHASHLFARASAGALRTEVSVHMPP